MLTIPTEAILPDREAIITYQGVPADRPVRADVDAVLSETFGLFAETAAPVGIIEEVSAFDFELVFHGEGNNAPDAVVATVYPEAHDLALFVVTLGPTISEKIDNLFKTNEPAQATMLDAIASLAVDKAAEFLETRFFNDLAEIGGTSSDTIALRYSPGYCGWDITGQKQLFEYLHPQRIGVSLRESCLMQPLQSISGIILVGPKEIHHVDTSLPFCEQCQTKSCQNRGTPTTKPQ